MILKKNVGLKEFVDLAKLMNSPKGAVITSEEIGPRIMFSAANGGATTQKRVIRFKNIQVVEGGEEFCVTVEIDDYVLVEYPTKTSREPVNLPDHFATNLLKTLRSPLK